MIAWADTPCKARRSAAIRQQSVWEVCLKGFEGNLTSVSFQGFKLEEGVCICWRTYKFEPAWLQINDTSLEPLCRGLVVFGAVRKEVAIVDSESIEQTYSRLLAELIERQSNILIMSDDMGCFGLHAWKDTGLKVSYLLDVLWFSPWFWLRNSQGWRIMSE